jgi:hypothetical protein
VLQRKQRRFALMVAMSAVATFDLYLFAASAMH